MLQTFQQGSPQIPLEFGILLMIIRSLTIFFHIFLQYHILKYEVCNLEKSFFKEERYEVGFRLNVTKLSKAQSVEELWFFLSEPIYLVSKNDWWFFFFIFLWINIFLLILDYWLADQNLSLCSVPLSHAWLQCLCCTMH